MSYFPYVPDPYIMWFFIVHFWLWTDLWNIDLTYLTPDLSNEDIIPTLWVVAILGSMLVFNQNMNKVWQSENEMHLIQLQMMDIL